MPPKKFVPAKDRKKVAEAAAAAAAAGGSISSGTDLSLASLSTAADEIAAAAAAPAYGGAGAAAVRTATGLLQSEKRSRDVKIGAFSLSLYGQVLVEDTNVELTWGARYGLVGRNGCGKSTLLQCLANREVPIPEHIDTYLLAEEAQPSEASALEYVVASAVAEVARLDALAERLMEESGGDSEELNAVYDRQAELDPATFESRASLILVGLGFDARTIHKKTKDMSGGWRMRVALARALFISPSLLCLDEPTNHLDLEACVWLEDYLSRYPKILVVVSHSQDFLNGVCNAIMVMQNRKLRYWSGNYDMYVKTRGEQDKSQIKAYEKQQEEIAHIKAFIASCGTYANLVRQAKSREKQLQKMVDDGLIELPFVDPIFRFAFPDTGKMPPPLISFSDVAFSYSGKKEDYLFTKLAFGIDSDSRVALVGPNGAGKSTLLKLMVRENSPTEGTVNVKSGIVIGRYHQHSAEVLDEEATPVEYISKRFHDAYPEKKLEEWRGVVGNWGIPSDYHLLPIKCLSDGLKTRLVFCEIALRKPHILLLDEPTNAADMEMSECAAAVAAPSAGGGARPPGARPAAHLRPPPSPPHPPVDSMAAAIKAFPGGVVVISHDFRLLSQVAREIWVVDHGVKVWDGDIVTYKKHLIKKSLGAVGDKMSGSAHAVVGSGGKK